MLEPTLFDSNARRDWVLLLPETDCHAWSPLESFIMLAGQVENLKRVSSFFHLLILFFVTFS